MTILAPARISLGVWGAVFVLFKGYIDESYDGSARNLFALSCLIADSKGWFEIERAWRLHLEAKNKQLKRQGRRLISRYHASECSGRRGEFDGWTLDERDEFVLGLFGILKRSRGVHAVAYDVQLDELCEVFPEWAKDRLETAYAVLPKFIMYTVGDDFQQMAPKGAPIQIDLIHDWTGGTGEYDPTILRSFQSQMRDSDFPHKNYFRTIVAERWENCIPLQPADLVAFEWLKEAQAKLIGRKSRKSFQALLDMNSFGIHAKSFNRSVLLQLRERMERDKALVQ